jgi:Holliday junction resolvase RusA-like endonuclease
MEYKHYARMVASLHKPNKPLTGALEVSITVYRPIPKSFSKKKSAEAERGLIVPTSKPDASNYAKLIEDACNGIIWRDDSQIVDLIVKKRFSSNPRVEVTVQEL